MRTSLWLTPALMSAAALGLALVVTRIPLELDAPDSLWWLHQGDGRDASGLLSALLSSMITMATLVISITMVVLTLAAGQLGPRLIRNFMQDRRTKLCLGLFTAAIVYLVMVLRTLDGSAPESAVPHLAVTLGTVIMVAAVFTLLFYVHHLARSIIADTVINRVGDSLDRALASAFPQSPEPAPGWPAAQGAGEILRFDQSGYVQGVDTGALVRTAAKAGVFVELRFRPGDYLLRGGEHLSVTPPGVLDDEAREALRKAVVIGPERAEHQDPDFPARQIVEVALRALSPGINDAFTAMAAVDRLSGAAALIADRADPPTVWCDDEGRARLRGPAPSFGGFVDLAFAQIIHAAANQPAVLAVVQERLGGLKARVSGERGVALDALLAKARSEGRHTPS